MAAAVGSIALGSLAPGAASAATELTPSSDPLPGSTFQAGDGNQSPIAGDPTRQDWGSPELLSSIRQTVDPSNPDSAFGGGSKENQPDGWTFAYPSDSTPLKANFRVIWGLLGSGDPDQFLYLGFRRAENGGNAYLAFELNQEKKSWTNAAGATIPCRTTGDLIITYNVQNNDSTKIFLTAQKWVTSTSDPATGCARTGSLTDITSLVDGVNVQGAVNNPTSPTLPGEIPSPRPQAGAIPSLLESSPVCNSTSGWICDGLFGEAGLNLTGLFDGAAGDGCFSFGSFWAHGRSSEAVNSEMQDYVAPAPARVRSCTVSGSKWNDLNGNGVWDEPAEPAVEGWKVWLDLNHDDEVDAPAEIATTDSEGVYEFKEVPTGNYTVRELPAADQDGAYRQGLTTCTFPKVDCDKGHSVALTKDEPNSTGNDFGNYAKPKLELLKKIDPKSDPGKFDLVADSVPTGGDRVEALGVGDGGTSGVTQVKAAKYALSESASSGTDPADYLLGSVQCFNRSDDSAFPVTAGTITLAGGQDVYCSWTNTRKAKVTIAKVTDPTSAKDEFSFSGPGDPPASFQLAGGESKPFGDLVPGKGYSWSETVPSGWDLTSIKCTGTDGENVKVDGSTVTVTPQPGESVECTFTNTRRAKVTIAKVTDPTSAKDEFSFTGPGDPPASFQLAGGESKPFADLVPGKGYAFSETVPSGWDLTSIKCTGTDGDNVKVVGSTVTVTPQPGENVECTYSNTQRAKVTIAKATDPTSAKDEFSFSGPGDPPASFQLAGGESKPFGDLVPGKGYSWSETVPSGWDLTSIKCTGTDGENVKTELSTGSVTVTPQPGENVECTYTNTQRAKITITKATDPAAAPDKFDFTGPGDPPASFQLSDGESKDFANLVPGSPYPFAEKAPAGWSVSSIKCTGTAEGNVKVDLPNGSVTVTPQPGEDVTCVYANLQERGSISGSKFNDLNGNGVWNKPEEPAVEGWKVGLDKDSSGTIDPGEPVATTDSTGAYSFTGLLLGKYTVLEIPAADQATSELRALTTCSLPTTDCDKGYSVTLDANSPSATGKDFGNYAKPQLELRKQVGPATDTGKFDLFANTVPAGPEPAVSVLNVGNGSTFSPTAVAPGTYALSEAAHAGTTGGNYTFGDPECFNRSDDSPVPVTDGKVTLSGGQDVYCSWLNIRTGAFIKGKASISGTTGCARGRYAYARIAGSPITKVTWYVNHKRYTAQTKRNRGRYFQLKLRVGKLHRSYYAITAVVGYSRAAIPPRTVKRKLAFRICRPLRSTG